MRGGAGAFADRSVAHRKDQKPRLGERRSFLEEAKQLGGSTCFSDMSVEVEKRFKTRAPPGRNMFARRRCRGNWIRNAPAPLKTHRVFSANREPEPASRTALRLCG